MNEPLPEEFDVIIVGTGLPESVLSGALSRIDKKVLHIDPNTYYGSSWASFNLNSFDDFIKSNSEADVTTDFKVKELLSSNEQFLPITSRSCISHGKSFCFLSTKPLHDLKEDINTKEDNGCQIPEKFDCEEKSLVEDENTKDSGQASENNVSSEQDDKYASAAFHSTIENDEVSQSCDQENIEYPEIAKAPVDLIQFKPELSAYDEFYSRWRHFNIDLVSKILFSRGLLVELLIQSNVSRYLEFRNVSRLLTVINGKLQSVPCTRADVFKTKDISVVQKRFLMRILTMCANIDQHPDVEEEFKDKLFVEFLKANKLSNDTQHFIIHSIAMVNSDTSAIEGIHSTRKFLHSLGRYGNSAFLFPLYGVGELPQAFSRLSAVFGGTFCLRRHAVGIIVNQETGQCKAIIDSTGQRIACKYLILNESNAPDIATKEFQSCISRAIYVTNRSVMPTSTEHVSLISIPPIDENSSIRLVELGPATSVCSSKSYLIHATTVMPSTSSKNPEEIFSYTEKLLFSAEGKSELQNSSIFVPDENSVDIDKPKLLWRAYFNMNEKGVNQELLPSNVFIMNEPGVELGFDSAMQMAQRIFETICPENEFLPRAPEPDEIIFADEGYNTEKNGSSSSEEQGENDGEYAENVDDPHQDESTQENESVELPPNVVESAQHELKGE